MNITSMGSQKKGEESQYWSKNPVRNVLSKKGFELKERIEALSTYHSVNI